MIGITKMKGKAFHNQEVLAIDFNRKKTQFRDVISPQPNFVEWLPVTDAGISKEGFYDSHDNLKEVKPEYEVGEIIFVQEEVGMDAPKYARFFLKITDVSVEKIKSISEKDAIAEGIESISHVGPMRAFGWKDYSGGIGFFDTIKPFQSLWVATNGRESWDANEWVFVYSFERVEQP